MKKVLLLAMMCVVGVILHAQPQPPQPTTTWSADNKTVTLTLNGGPAELDNWLKNTDNRAELNRAEKLIVVCEGNAKVDIRKLLGEFTEGPNTFTALTVPYIDLSQAKFDQEADKCAITNPNVKGVKLGDTAPTATIDATNYDDLVIAQNNQVTAKCTTDGNLAGFMAAFPDESFSKLTVTGTLGSTDAGALNATNVFLDGVTNMTAKITDINGGNQIVYLRLPNDKTSAADVVEMGKLKQNGNANLKMVGAYDPDNDNKDGNGKWAEVAMHSFEVNNVVPFITAMNIPVSGNPNPVPRQIRMSGEYGDKDLVSNGATGTPNFGHGTSAEWDFTGAHFANCKIPSVTATYYKYDDPFCEGSLVAPTTSSNAFYYFKQYTTAVVDIKLPDTNMTNLPYRCLNDLGAQNKDGYIALYGQNAFDANKAEANCVPLETLVIPNCYTDLEEECGKWARIRHLVVGSGMKRIHGGAFLKCDYLEDLDFGAGLSNCYIGDRAFNECKSMKHIALSEGIVSLGNGCFWNSQHLESIRLPQSLINMGNNCFNNCLALNSITIPDNVEKIGQNAFTLCPFTDIYLTTTDPDKIPMVWSAGTGFSAGSNSTFDGRCTFNHGHIDGWEGGVDAYQSQIDNQMTWDQAAAFYYMNWNGMPVLHFPTQLRDKVRSFISSDYAMKTKADEDGNQYGLPLRVDIDKRANISGADLGSSGQGKYTQDGWAQFMLMKEIASGPGSVIYQKEYDDVWYTMCFPFDLTDEQLAAAFNETFNIVDFSGVEVVEAAENDGQSMKLILHFNNVAVTDYKDTDGKHYKRKMNGSEVIREKDETSGFYYNVYLDDNETEYHHVTTSNQLSTNKTKTFAPGSTMSAAQSTFNSTHKAYIIDGILATAGHPYLIHPAIGVVAGQPKQRCTFAGIEWLRQSTWPEVFTNNSRTIDLGEDLTVKVDSNYNHPGYAGYEGQKYTFIGNPKLLRTDIADYPADLQEPTVENGQLVELPKISSYTTLYPKGPAMPAARKAVVDEYGEKMTEADMPTAPEEAANPADDTENYPSAFQTLYNSVHRAGVWNGSANVDYIYGEDIISSNVTDFGEPQYAYLPPTYSATFTGYKVKNDASALKTYWGLGDNDQFQESDFTALQSLCSQFKEALDGYAADMERYNQYLEDLAAYNANVAAWANYESAHATEEAEYQDALNTYNTAVSNWQTAYEAAESANKDAIAAWQAAIVPYQVYIPKNAYFLGRKTGQLPKFYRETGKEPEVGQPSPRSGGAWTQFTAIVIPNEAALNGIEKGISNKQAHSKGFDMLFNEDFEGDYILIDDNGIATAIEEAKKAGADVKYMDIVVSINGEIVRRGSTSIEGLPKGVYIINGKKYFVK